MDVYLSDLLRGVGVIGLTCGLFWMLATGRLAVGREIREKNARIDALEAALKVRDHQLSVVLNEAMTTISPVLKAMRSAIDAEGEEGST